jgi:hypothetical protein
MVTEIYIARDTFPLVYSSCMFLIPAVYSYCLKYYFYAIFLLITFGISANYWRKATYGFRRNLDLVFSKISFSVFVTTHIYYLYLYSSLYNKSASNTKLPIIYYIISYSNLFFITYFYSLSTYFYKKNNIGWMRYHMLFHLFCNLNISLIIYLKNIGSLSNFKFK